MVATEVQSMNPLEMFRRGCPTESLLADHTISYFDGILVRAFDLRRIHSTIISVTYAIKYFEYSADRACFAPEMDFYHVLASIPCESTVSGSVDEQHENRHDCEPINR
jgi:hypothetical protein